MICNSSFANFGPAISSPTNVCSTTTCVVLKSSLFLESTRGTKGKGSTSSRLASMLQPSGGTRAGAPAPHEPAELRSADTRRRLYPHKLCLGLAYFFVHWSTHSFTVLYQRREFCGFSTQ